MISSMSDLIPFKKYHGLGNDFIVFDGIRHTLAIEQLSKAKVAALLCDRHLGIGADGLLFVLLPTNLEHARAKMIIINSDGSRAQMCGNGIRCVAKMLHDHHPEIAAGLASLPIETDAGILSCHLTCDHFSLVSSVCVNMGAPRLQKESLPMLGSGDFIDQEIDADGQCFQATAVSMGNPHLVIFVDDDKPLRLLAEKYGPLLEHHHLFPQRTNVEFARYGKNSEIELVVWERGCGITLACGTGACATVVAAEVTGRHPRGQTAHVRLLGGTLHITVEDKLASVLMAGPATEVFGGNLDLPKIQSSLS